MSEYVYLYRACETGRSREKMQWTMFFPRNAIAVDASGNLKSLFDQGRSEWVRELIAHVQDLLNRSAQGTELNGYYIEAGIASIHFGIPYRRHELETNRIPLRHLDDRPAIPIVALNRAIAVAQIESPERGIQEINAIAGSDRLAGYHFYFVAR